VAKAVVMDERRVGLNLVRELGVPARCDRIGLVAYNKHRVGERLVPRAGVLQK
jgi:hypothetical protein